MNNKVEKLEEAANDVIKAFDVELIGLKRKNNLTVLAQKFSMYETTCLELANKGVSTSSFPPGRRVMFLETREKGIVSSTSDLYVFVKFDHLIPDAGIDDMSGQACLPEKLILLEGEDKGRE